MCKWKLITSSHWQMFIIFVLCSASTCPTRSASNNDKQHKGRSILQNYLSLRSLSQNNHGFFPMSESFRSMKFFDALIATTASERQDSLQCGFSLECLGIGHHSRTIKNCLICHMQSTDLLSYHQPIKEPSTERRPSVLPAAPMTLSFTSLTPLHSPHQIMHKEHPNHPFLISIAQASERDGKYLTTYLVKEPWKNMTEHDSSVMTWLDLNGVTFGQAHSSTSVAVEAVPKHGAAIASEHCRHDVTWEGRQHRNSKSAKLNHC